MAYRSGNSIACLISTDNGLSFTGMPVASAEYITNPAICVSGNGTPYIVWGQYAQIITKGPQDPGWHLQYYVKWRTGTGWSERLLYDFIVDDNPFNPPPDTNNYLSPPSITVTTDSGYVGFSYYHLGVKVNTLRFLLSNPAYHSTQVIAPALSLAPKFTALGYDKGGRILVSFLPDIASPPKIYWRNIGSSAWRELEIPLPQDYIWPAGSPSLWAG
ncbi:MAG: hypothetical protein N3A65_10110, partial [candidate division WOR-3 bacterium]|nr:hypothetical protein [candidate division WOR-3 bacterium]